MNDWVKRKMALLSFALSNVEKDSLGQKTDALVGHIDGSNQSYHQGNMADDLLRGELTMPVKELRWRLYKILNESKGKTAKIIGYDGDGIPIVETYDTSKYQLDKILRDDADPYDVELVINNVDATKSLLDTFSNEELDIFNDEKLKEVNEVKPVVKGEDYKEEDTQTDNRFNQSMDKYDLVVEPGANANQIKIEYEGVDSLYLRNGKLYVITSLNENWEETIRFSRQAVQNLITITKDK